MVAVAIDGPAGAGKSSIAKRAAAELGFIYVDTGAIYRAVALSCLQKGIDPQDSGAVEERLNDTDIRIVFFNKEQHILLNDEDVSAEIRREEISMAASKVSAIPAVRTFLLDLQRNFAKTENVIMDGRDIGTVVLPNAQVKIFLTAMPTVRAVRRMLQLEEQGEKNLRYETILADIVMRDDEDTHREIAPLKPADNAVIVDTTDLDFEESVQRVIELIREVMQ